MLRNSLFIALALIIFACKENTESKSNYQTNTDNTEEESPLFEKVDLAHSGLEFSNSLQHDVGSMENLFDYDYFYNGAGVGLEDLNNDGLLDVFFCGNQVANRLFLNEGNMKFRDVSDQAGISSNKGWSTGVTFVDIDGNGWMDIYVTQGGPRRAEDRKNSLYINQKDGTFTEEAESYGLADTGIGTQSAFFDFDNDGDLDCVVMNENELYGIDPINLFRILKENPELQTVNSSHLYRNDGGKYTDVTVQAGIQRPIFGLGLSVTDINRDGWLDIYIASDYFIPDALFINNKNGSFTDKIKDYTQQISYYGMGIDIADINNDNLQDIFVLDMASSDHVRSKTLMASMSTGRFDYLVNKADFQHQYMYNSLQLNLGNNQFNNIAQLSEMANTDWSWAVILSDFDHDEYKDAFITNGYRRYALDNDLQRSVFEAKQKYRGRVPLEVKNQLYNEMPSEKLGNILYRNNGGLEFKNVAPGWGIGDLSFSNGAATGDLDNDGDLDMVVNNMDDNAFLYKNLAVDQNRGNYLGVALEGSHSEPFATVEVFYGENQQMVEVRRVRGYMSSLEDKAHFGLGKTSKLDSVKVTWLGGKSETIADVSANKTIVFNERNATASDELKTNNSHTLFAPASQRYGLDFEHRENVYDDFETEILLPYKQSAMGPFISTADINGDGKEDIHVGGASGYPGAIYLNSGRDFKKLSSEALDNDRAYEDMESVFFDLEGDGDMDLFIVSGGNEHAASSSLYEDRVYLNDGKGNFSRLQMETLSKSRLSGKTVTALDYDKDGDHDILVGNRIIPQQYPKHSPSVLYENREGILIDVTSEIAPELNDFGIVNKTIKTDYDNDGWIDFIAVGEWTGIGLFRNEEGNFKLMPAANTELNNKGWWFDILETDINNDGLKDYVVGNAGMNIKFKSSAEKPFKVFATDFDDNGTNDIVLSKKYHDTYVPVRGRECSSQQMPFIKEKFPTYSEFANASLGDIYGEKLDVSYEKEVNEFKSIVLINRGDGKFDKSVLPVEAQMFPTLDISTFDFNNDGYEDLILSGNIYETEVETPRLDAISGLVLLSDGKENFIPLPHYESGLYLKGNVKSAGIIQLGEENLFLNTTNNGPFGVHKILPLN